MEEKKRFRSWLAAVSYTHLGFISRDGMYTAPNQPGVYEIQAWCQEMPKLRASLYVIVRE